MRASPRSSTRRPCRYPNPNPQGTYRVPRSLTLTLALQGTSFSFEGTSLDWQRFARAWNAIVQSLRQRDMVLHLEY